VTDTGIHAARLLRQVLDGDDPTIVLLPTAERAERDGLSGAEWRALLAESDAAVSVAVAELRRRGCAVRVERRPGRLIHPDVETAVIVEAVRLPHGAAA
jgi:biotin operon repressor